MHSEKPEHGVRFEYKENFVIPILAMDEAGNPYTGKAEGAIGAADWSGFFVEGRPHGEFQIVWGGIRSVKCRFEHGHRVEQR